MIYEIFEFHNKTKSVASQKCNGAKVCHYTSVKVVFFIILYNVHNRQRENITIY